MLSLGMRNLTNSFVGGCQDAIDIVLGDLSRRGIGLLGLLHALPKGLADDPTDESFHYWNK